MRPIPKPARIVIWFCFFMSLFVGIAQFVPVHPKLKIPRLVFLQPEMLPQRTDICFVGDCAVRILPWDGIKVGVPLAGSDKIIPVVNEINLPSECRTFYVMSGTYLLASGESISFIQRDTQKIVSAVRKRCPSATIHVIPIDAYNDIAREHSTNNDKYHLDDAGHGILYQQYAHLLVPSNEQY